jgi:hypothetical protein
MGLLRRLFGGTSTFRRGPGFDLDDYARMRGLQAVAEETPRGVVAAVGLDPRLRFNLVRRGVDGFLLAHVLEPFGVGSNDTHYRPWTVAAMHVPEAIGTVVRLRARRDHKPSTSRAWRTLDAEAVGLPGYMVEGAPRTDEVVLAQALDGVAGQWLGAHEALLAFEYGCLWLARRDFTREPRALDELTATLDALSERLRARSLASLAQRGLPEALPPPPPTDGLGLAEAAEEVREWVPAFASRRGLTAEDPLAFHRAFPSAPLAGQAFGVFRNGKARLVVTTEVRLPDNLGDDAALVALPEPVTASDRPWTPAPGVTASVRDGVLVVVRRRAGDAGISGPALLQLGELAVGLADAGP